MEGSGEEREKEVPSEDEKNLRFDLDFLRVVGAIVSKSSCEYLGHQFRRLFLEFPFPLEIGKASYFCLDM